MAWRSMWEFPRLLHDSNNLKSIPENSSAHEQLQSNDENYMVEFMHIWILVEPDSLARIWPGNGSANILDACFCSLYSYLGEIYAIPVLYPDQ